MAAACCTAGLFVWVNPSGKPNQTWHRYSVSYHRESGRSVHSPQLSRPVSVSRVSLTRGASVALLLVADNLLWDGPDSYLFDERINSTEFFESQSYTSLMQVGPNDAYVTYGKYYNISNGQPGCFDTWPTTGHGCSSGFGMRIHVE
jgi:hypothetical protein